MATFNFTGLIDYEFNFGTDASKGDGTNDVGPIGSSGEDDDTDFEVNEDLTGIGNDYIGFLTVNGVDLPVIYGSNGATTDFNSVFVGLYGSITRDDLPNSFTTNDPEFSATTFFYCFAEGTLIRTPHGEVPVEELSREDLVQTESGAAVPVHWIGVQSLSAPVAAVRQLGLVRVAAGALGEGLPHSDLTVTGDHGMIVDGLVVNAAALVNGETIDWVPLSELPARVTLYHVETDNHDVILANGAPAETFIDIPGRMSFDNYQVYLDLYGTERIIPEMDRPRISSKRLLPDDIKARLGIKDELIDIEDFGDLRLRA